jgi:hypothetical protein
LVLFDLTTEITYFCSFNSILQQENEGFELLLTTSIAVFCQTISAQALYVSSGETVFISSGTTVTSTSGVTTIVSGGTLNVAGEYQSAGNFTNSGTLTATSGTLTL